MWVRRRRQPRPTVAAGAVSDHGPTRVAPRDGQGSPSAVPLLDGVGDDDGGIRRLSRVRAGHVGLRPRLGVPVRLPRIRVPGARLPGRRGVGVGLAGWRLQLGAGRCVRPDGAPGRLVRVRPDDLLLPGAARLRRRDARLRHRSEAGRQWRLQRRRHHRSVLGWRVHLLAGSRTRGEALLERDADRDPDPGGNPRRSRHHLPAAGKPLGCPDEHAPSPAGVDGYRQRRPGRQQLLHLRRHRGECRTC